MPGRQYNNGNYRYGFNGKEKDDEVKGNANSVDYGSRMYDSRLGRWLSIDPLQGNYPNFSPYNFCLNNPVELIDENGKWVRDQNGNLIVTIDKQLTKDRNNEYTIRGEIHLTQ